MNIYNQPLSRIEIMYISDNEKISTYDIFVKKFNVEYDQQLTVGDVREIADALQDKIRAIDNVNIDDLSNQVAPS
jgi:2-methylcitrate dehydratase PrpD